MARVEEIGRFEVRSEDGGLHTVIHYQEYVGGRGDEIEGYQRFETLNGKGVNRDEEDHDLFYLPIGLTSPWVAARRV
ncbi:hypothetical protein [Pseudomonas putida]|uniref:hypothetical protein n=1 Tax=Pseudomonas putida TaxID=303 RepID=UPI000F780170|nr:hypothetical protein [Pseudomonas putida]